MCCPCHSVPFARLTLQTATPRFCRSCLKIQLLKDSGYPSHFTKYCTLLPFRCFFRTLWILYTSSSLMTFCISSALNVPSRISPWSSLTKYTGGLVSIHFTTVSNSSVQLGKYPFLNVRLALLSRTLSPGENLHDFLGPFLPYSLLDTVVWLAHVTSAGWYAYGSVNGVVIRCDHLG